ncbi:TetR/AcrR family transcriptional regulator [Cumulibacter soli]|uniref:TetR/AcrR family transcriptional regulator n=1 Tax=Cumulibacter soli TaxID=2546344 RepID=UPI001FB9E91E|nr:TetR/AcrR family transcriptional regulator [Cumulibacter soli]
MSPAKRRTPLSRERIVAAAVAIADANGATGVTMRAVAARLGVEAMSLYNHVAGRDGILDGMVDAIFAEIELPAPGDPWRPAMRARARSAREALKGHRWAVGLMDSRANPGPATLTHHDAVLGNLRANGFSVVMAAHAVSLIDSYVYGFVLQEVSLPFDNESQLHDVAEGILAEGVAERFPYLAEIAMTHAMQPGYEYGDEFTFGLALILDALEPDES